MKFVHTADWQFGKAFERFDPGVGAALTEARFVVIDMIEAAERMQGILLACRGRANRLVPATRLSLFETAE